MPDSCTFVLRNSSTSNEVYAYISGIAIQHNGARVLMKANGKDLYFPKAPKEILQPLAEDCAIPLGPPGNAVSINVPQIAGGRVWFSMDGKLTFLLNPGPALVEPSVLNPSDPNAKVNFGFAEFTLNNDQLFANISYVDFVPRIPIALHLENVNGQVQQVAGMAQDGLDKICEGLRQQSQKDGRPWEKLIVQHDGRNLRALNATHGNAVGANFDGYYEPYVDKAWEKLSKECCKVNTQAGPGILEGKVNKKGELVIGNECFSKPTTADILGCNSGPFTTGPSAERNAIIPRLAAAFVRTTMLCEHEHPSQPRTFYNEEPTNHYARIVHENNLDGKGYAFAYDDVQPDDGDDQSGKVNDGTPKLFTIIVGGDPSPGHDSQSTQQPEPPAPVTQVGSTSNPSEHQSRLGKAFAAFRKH